MDAEAQANAEAAVVARIGKEPLSGKAQGFTGSVKVQVHIRGGRPTAFEVFRRIAELPVDKKD